MPNTVVGTRFIAINKAGKNKILLSWNATFSGGKLIGKTNKKK